MYRPLRPTDLSPFNPAAMLLQIVEANTIQGTFRGIDWIITRAGADYGRYAVAFKSQLDIDLSHETNTWPTLAEAFDMVYVIGIRLGKEAT